MFWIWFTNFVSSNIVFKNRDRVFNIMSASSDLLIRMEEQRTGGTLEAGNGGVSQYHVRPRANPA